MSEEPERNRRARAAAERALVRIVHHYAGRPEFVVLGGLVPDLLCADSEYQHAGTTDIDVQVNLEIACGAVQTQRLELALRNAEFTPDDERVWRWKADGLERGTVIKFELLADLGDKPAGAHIHFDECEALGAANLRGTGFASRDFEVRELRARIGGVDHVAEVNVTGLAGFLLAKCAAAASRRKPNDQLRGTQTALRDLGANFEDASAQGPRAYADQMLLDHPDSDGETLRADAVLAVSEFCWLLFE